MNPDRERRFAFNDVARLYDEARPGYPEALLDALVTLSGIKSGGDVLEIGCGTGQATVPLARRGCTMLCLDIGADMIAIAKEHCRPFQNVTFRVTSFEEWEPEEEFDLVVAATAFHWVEPGTAYAKVARVLREGGHFAQFRNVRADPQADVLDAIQNVYEQCVPEWGRLGPSDAEAEIQEHVRKVEQSGRFGKTLVRRFPFSVDYAAGDYVKLLHTYSDHLKLEKEKFQRLCDGIADAIERFGGVLTRTYVAALVLAQKENEA